MNEVRRRARCCCMLFDGDDIGDGVGMDEMDGVGEDIKRESGVCGDGDIGIGDGAVVIDIFIFTRQSMTNLYTSTHNRVLSNEQ